MCSLTSLSWSMYILFSLSIRHNWSPPRLLCTSAVRSPTQSNRLCRRWMSNTSFHERQIEKEIKAAFISYWLTPDNKPRAKLNTVYSVQTKDNSGQIKVKSVNASLTSGGFYSALTCKDAKEILINIKDIYLIVIVWWLPPSITFTSTAHLSYLL